MEPNTVKAGSPDKMAAKYPSDLSTEIVEDQVKKIPNLLFMALAGVSIVGSLALLVTKKQRYANFVGLWAPTILLLGVYNKIVKVEDELLSKQDKMLH